MTVAIGSYTTVTAGTFGSPEIATFNAYLRTEPISLGGGEYDAIFKIWLESGQVYTIACEGEFTQSDDFTINFLGTGESPEGYWGFGYWNPSNVGAGRTSATEWFEGEDISPYNSPYTYKLNEESGILDYWQGGFRLRFTAQETGYFYFGLIRLSLPK